MRRQALLFCTLLSLAIPAAAQASPQSLSSGCRVVSETTKCNYFTDSGFRNKRVTTIRSCVTERRETSSGYEIVEVCTIVVITKRYYRTKRARVTMTRSHTEHIVGRGDHFDPGPQGSGTHGDPPCAFAPPPPGGDSEPCNPKSVPSGGKG